MSEDENYPEHPYKTISRNVPYIFRWKILEMKLMLNDVLELSKKHNLKNAEELYEQLKEEFDSYILEMIDNIIKSKMKKKKVIEVVAGEVEQR